MCLGEKLRTKGTLPKKQFGLTCVFFLFVCLYFVFVFVFTFEDFCPQDHLNLSARPCAEVTVT